MNKNRNILMFVFAIVLCGSVLAYALQNTIGPGGQGVFISDADNNVANVTSTGLLDIHNADFHIDPVIVHAGQATGITSTIGNAGATSGDFSFDVDIGDGVLFSVGDKIFINEGAVSESCSLQILTIAVDTITVDMPLENNYTTAATVAVFDINLANADGSVTREIYSSTPPLDEVWHITTITMILENTIALGQPSIDLFGAIPALTRGLVLRIEDGTDRNIRTFRTNSDFMEYFGGINITFEQKVGGGNWLTTVVWPLKNLTDAIIKLDGSIGDTANWIIQDDLSIAGSVNIEIVFQGHKEGT